MQLGDMMGVQGALLLGCSAVVAPLDSPLRNGAAGNTALVLHAGRLVAMNESTPPFEVHVDAASGAIRSRGEHLWGGKEARAFTAHPKVDPATGEMLTFGLQCALLRCLLRCVPTPSPDSICSDSHCDISSEYGHLLGQPGFSRTLGLYCSCSMASTCQFCWEVSLI